MRQITTLASEICVLNTPLISRHSIIRCSAVDSTWLPLVLVNAWWFCCMSGCLQLVRVLRLSSLIASITRPENWFLAGFALPNGGDVDAIISELVEETGSVTRNDKTLLGV
jgi:hypothetical protein